MSSQHQNNYQEKIEVAVTLKNQPRILDCNPLITHMAITYVCTQRQNHKTI